MWVVLFLLAGASAINPIVIKGNKLFDSVTKQRFVVKGVDYAPDPYPNLAQGGTARLYTPGEDHFSDDHEPLWSRDIPLLAELGVNAVRLYDFDPTKSHGRFMSALAQHGIYAIVGMTATTGDGVLAADRPSPECYSQGLVRSVKLRINEFAKYDNTLMFVVGNEVANAVQYKGQSVPLPGFPAIPCVKALTRDMRAYMKSCACGMRQIPIIYAATDLGVYDNGRIQPRMLISQYLMCGDHNVDAYGINIYTWCARDAGYDFKSTYKRVNDEYANLDLPIMFTEYGCNQGDFRSDYPFTQGQRTWTQVRVLFNEMLDVFSGGLAYQYSMTENNYGLVLLPGYDRNNPNTIVKLENFNNLKREYANANPSEFGSWTETDRCTWLPANSATKRRPTCPSAAEVQELFDVAGFVGVTQNWFDELPPHPVFDEEVSCPTFPMTATTRAEVACKASCVCSSVVTEPSCRIPQTTPPDQVGALISHLCGFMALADVRFCDDISATANGQLSGCDAVTKANYLLQKWFELKGGHECCSTLATSDTCASNYDCGAMGVASTCSVRASQNEASLGDLITLMCGKLTVLSPDSCADISPIGEFGGCSVRAKANHVLKAWLDVQGGRECCADLVSKGECTAVAPDTRLAITRHPRSATVQWRAATSLSVAVAGGFPPYAYTWKKNGALIGGSGDTLLFAAVEETDAGVYQVVVTDSAGAKVTSSTATLTVPAPHAAAANLRLTGTSPQVLSQAGTKARLAQAIATVLTSFGVAAQDVGFEAPVATTDPNVADQALRVRVASSIDISTVALALAASATDGSLNRALGTAGLTGVAVVSAEQVCLPSEIELQGTLASSGCGEAALPVGAACEFRCNDDAVKVSGSDSRTCTSTGWTGAPLVCRLESAPTSPPETDSTVIYIVIGAVAVLVVAGVVVFLVSRRGKSASKRDAPRNDLYAPLNEETI